MTNQFISQQQLEAHSEWLNSGGTTGKRLVLLGANLQDAYLESAILEEADLRDADLRSANLRCATLRSVDLRGADLRGADLGSADMQGASMSGANLEGANLEGADLRRANLSGANLLFAELRLAQLPHADLTGATGLKIFEGSDERLKAVAKQVLDDSERLTMDDWHSSCGTAHCLAGWAIHQAGAWGAALENRLGSEIAGLMLLGVEAHSHFFDPKDCVLSWLSSLDLTVAHDIALVHHTNSLEIAQ